MPPRAGLPQTEKPARAADYPYDPRPAVLPKSTPAAGGKLAPWLADLVAALALVAICLAFNAVVPFPLTKMRSNNEVVAGIMVAVLATQFGALCTALVFGEARFWLRLPVVWVIGFALCGAFQLGLHLSERSHDVIEDLQMFWAMTPLAALAVQLPLWAVKTYFGWRIGRPEAILTRPRALSIGDILMGTTIAAVSVMAVRLTPYIDPHDNTFWIAWAIGFSSVVGISLVSLIPAMYFVLRLENKLAGAIVCLVYSAIASGVTVAIVAFVNREYPPPSDFWIVLGTMLPTLAASLFGLFHVFRWLGYRLVFPGDHWAAAEGGE